MLSLLVVICDSMFRWILIYQEDVKVDIISRYTVIKFPEITVSSSVIRCKKTELGPETQTAFISVRMSEPQIERH